MAQSKCIGTRLPPREQTLEYEYKAFKMSTKIWERVRVPGIQILWVAFEYKVMSTSMTTCAEFKVGAVILMVLKVAVGLKYLLTNDTKVCSISFLCTTI